LGAAALAALVSTLSMAVSLRSLASPGAAARCSSSLGGMQLVAQSNGSQPFYSDREQPRKLARPRPWM